MQCHFYIVLPQDIHNHYALRRHGLHGGACKGGGGSSYPIPISIYTDIYPESSPSSLCPTNPEDIPGSRTQTSPSSPMQISSPETIHNWCHLKPLGLIHSAERDCDNKADLVFISKDSPPPGMSQCTCVYLTCN